MSKFDTFLYKIFLAMNFSALNLIVYICFMFVFVSFGIYGIEEVLGIKHQLYLYDVALIFAVINITGYLTYKIGEMKLMIGNFITEVRVQNNKIEKGIGVLSMWYWGTLLIWIPILFFVSTLAVLVAVRE